MQGFKIFVFGFALFIFFGVTFEQALKPSGVMSDPKPVEAITAVIKAFDHFPIVA